MICKYARSDDQAFETVSFRLKEMVGDAGEVLSKKQGEYIYSFCTSVVLPLQ